MTEPSDILVGILVIALLIWLLFIFMPWWRSRRGKVSARNHKMSSARSVVANEAGTVERVEEQHGSLNQRLTSDSALADHEGELALRDTSPMTILGYHAGKGRGKSERRRALVRIYSSGFSSADLVPFQAAWGEALTVTRKNAMIRHIEGIAALRKGRRSLYAVALDQWAADILWIGTFQPGSTPAARRPKKAKGKADTPARLGEVSTDWTERDPVRQYHECKHCPKKIPINKDVCADCGRSM